MSDDRQPYSEYFCDYILDNIAQCYAELRSTLIILFSGSTIAANTADASCKIALKAQCHLLSDVILSV